LKLVHNNDDVNEMNDVNDVNSNNINSNRTYILQIHAKDAVRISTLDAGVVMQRLMAVRDIRRGTAGRRDTGRIDTGRRDTGCIVVRINANSWFPETMSCEVNMNFNSHIYHEISK
jgi:hypothetical protein